MGRRGVINHLPCRFDPRLKIASYIFLCKYSFPMDLTTFVNDYFVHQTSLAKKIRISFLVGVLTNLAKDP